MGSLRIRYSNRRLGISRGDLAGDLGFQLRQRGTTVPATDLIVAASAIRATAPLYHLDAHFDRIAETSDLDARNLSEGR